MTIEDHKFARVCNYVFKLVLLGDSSVGKSSLVVKYLDKTFDPSSPQTVGVDFGSTIIEIEDSLCKLQVWDTAGQERFRSIAKSYMRDAAIIFFVFDITKRDSFESVASWYRDAAKESAKYDEPAIMYLIGSKNDIEGNRAVSVNEAKEYAAEETMWMRFSKLQPKIYIGGQSSLGKTQGS